MNIYSQIKSNRRGTWLVVSVFIGLLIFIGLGVDYYYGGGLRIPLFTAIALLIGLASSYASYRYGDRLVLSSTRAREPDSRDGREKQWQNVVEEAAIAAGLPLPKVYVIDDPDPNAFATGRDPAHSSIVATKGLLETLNREELQGVAAHEMSHIKNYDIRLMLMVAVLVGSIALLADWAARSMFYGRRRDRNSSAGAGGAAALVMLVVWLVAVILAPILSQLIAMCVSRKREYLADASGAELTRNPLALAAALRKIDARPEPTRSINRGTAHLCIADPMGSAMGAKEGRLADLFATHPPINKRIEALNAMAYAK